MREPRRYLGDGVYARLDDYGIVLTTEDGIRATNTIVLEPAVIQALEEYLADYKKAVKAQYDDSHQPA